MYAHEGKAAEDVCKLTITAEDTDDAATFDETNLVTARTSTTANVKWTVDVAWTMWKPYSTPDLGSVIQEVVDRAGWAPGNSIALILAGEDQGPQDVDNAREWMSFENIQDPGDVDPDGVQGDGKNHPDKVPKLNIYYSTGATSVHGLYSQSQMFDVYPNPGEGMLNITLNAEGPAQIQIFNVMGQMVRSAEITSRSTMLNLSDMKTGMYVFRVVQNNRMDTQKVILK